MICYCVNRTCHYHNFILLSSTRYMVKILHFVHVDIPLYFPFFLFVKYILYILIFIFYQIILKTMAKDLFKIRG